MQISSTYLNFNKPVVEPPQPLEGKDSAISRYNVAFAAEKESGRGRYNDSFRITFGDGKETGKGR